MQLHCRYLEHVKDWLICIYYTFILNINQWMKDCEREEGGVGDTGLEIAAEI